MDPQTTTYEIECPSCGEDLEINLAEEQITDGRPNRLDVISCSECGADFEFTCVDGLIVPSQQYTDPFEEEGEDDEEDEDDEEEDDE